MYLDTTKDQTRISAKCLPNNSTAKPFSSYSQDELRRAMTAKPKPERKPKPGSVEEKVINLMSDGRCRTISEVAERLDIAETTAGRELVKLAEAGDVFREKHFGIIIYEWRATA